MSASGKRSFTDRFPAMNPKGGRSRRDPQPTVKENESGHSRQPSELQKPPFNFDFSACRAQRVLFAKVLVQHSHSQGMPSQFPFRTPEPWDIFESPRLS
jgi:hypothetical protein